jgi:hypothetical protein
MIHGAITLGYFMYTMVTGRFIYLPSILLLFQIPYILTLVLLCICTSISLLASTLIPPRALRTTVWDGVVGIPGLSEDFYTWLFKWGIIALTSVQDATLLIENEALQMPRTTSVEIAEEADLEQERAIRDGIGFRREWIRTGAMHRARDNGILTRTENFKASLYYLRATYRTYVALLVRYLRGEEVALPTPLRAHTPFSARAQTPYDEEEDEDYVFSDRDSSPVVSEDEEWEESVREEGTPRVYIGGTTPHLASSGGALPARSRREASPFERPFREPSPFLWKTRPVAESSSRRTHYRETTPLDTLKPNPSTTYNAFPSSANFSEDEDDDPTDPLIELLPDITSTLSSFIRPSSQTESEDSQLLIKHLASERVMTRSQYRRETESQRLETLIQYRRRARRDSNSTDEVYEIQPCVVCKMNPRVIVLWPCRYPPSSFRLIVGFWVANGWVRCLALCDECRQMLAIRNFSECSCCRKKVASYSRIFIP